MKIDKKNWNTYRFDEFAENISQRVEPQNTDLSIYVGLEHLDPDSLHIKRHGSPSDVEGTKLKFYKGDVIFGKRRAYQRKAALAEYDGICSAHAMVLRAKTDIIDERLFPFFFHSTIFQTRAIDISVGGLSPTINWKDLAKQEFSLPPKEEQARLAELLWAADEVVEREKILINKSRNIRLSLFEKITYKNVSNTKLGDCLCVKKIKSKAPHDLDRYIGLEHITSSSYNIKSYGYSNSVLADNFVFNSGDILYSKLRPYLDKAIIADFDGVCTTELLVYNANKKTSNKYVLNILHSKDFLNYIVDKSYGTKMPRVSHEIVSAYTFYLPKLEEQNNILKNISKIENSIMNAEKNVHSSQQLKSSLINQIF